ncbi:hypothetical protein [Kibdelosporangium persicum]|uniref:hypothetical protein n=1 Tax=Kibdelosporangium persicum TaxID=2698649 RepID=UPI0015643E22|nr:hypothetical protein [Kibdelosporangium persicum]
MNDLVLTAKRRHELAVLLDDEHRLKATYPKVAEYLDLAPNLSGTGDDRADASFDLRFVHYVTGGQAHSENPYWDVVAPAVSERSGRRVVDAGRPNGSARLAYAQMLLQGIYSYAIPSPETVGWIIKFCDGSPMVELGAGRGYWAALLSAAGVEVEAYDSEPPDQGDNVSFQAGAGQADVWHPVEGLDKLSAGDRSGDVLFLCWPPGWGNRMASEALSWFERAGGKRLVFIGEPKGGKTADDTFFDRLSAGWELRSKDAHYVSWWNLDDVAQAWVKR